MRNSTAVRVSADSVRAPEQELLSAMRSRDLATLSRLFAPEYLFTGAAGQVWGRDHALSDFARPDLCIAKLIAEVDGVILLSDAAVVTGYSEIEGNIGDTSMSGSYRFTRVWRRSGGQWAIVATRTSSTTSRGVTGALPPGVTRT